MQPPTYDSTIKSPERLLLEELFQQTNMTDLPAMSANVQELIALTNSHQATAKELTEVILKDFSLTSKILQVANSAYYARGVPVATISRAVTVVGFTVVRELATAIALFENLISNATAKDQLNRLMTKSFLSATQARLIATEKNLNVSGEDAFLCALLYTLGEIVVLAYLPERYQGIIDLVKTGMSLQGAVRKVLNGLTFLEVGREIALYWNFSEQFTETMVAVPPAPQHKFDSDGNLKNLVVFTNLFTGTICRGTNIKKLMEKFGPVLSITKKEAFAFIDRSIEAAEDTSEAIRSGLALLQVQDNINKARKDSGRPAFQKDQSATHENIARTTN